jgi:hypothetical protein
VRERAIECVSKLLRIRNPRQLKRVFHYPKNGNEVGAAISITISGCGLYTWKRSLFQLTQRVSLFPPPRSDLLIGNALHGAVGASPRCGAPLIPRLRRGATLYLAPTGLRWFLISSSGVARGCHEVPRWGTGTPPFPQQLSCKVRPNASGSLWTFPFLGLRPWLDLPRR